MWVALFVFCNPIEGCTAVTFDDQQPYYESEKVCNTYVEKKSELVHAKMLELSIPGTLYYKCVPKDKKEMEYI